MACAECRMRERSVVLLRERCIELEGEVGKLRRAGVLIAQAERVARAEKQRADRAQRSLRAVRNALRVQIRHAARLAGILQATFTPKSDRRSALDEAAWQERKRARNREWMRQKRAKEKAGGGQVDAAA